MKNFLGAIWKAVPLISCEGVVIFQGLFGIVAKKSNRDESWKAYCAFVSPDDINVGIDKEKKDIEAIMKHGTLLTEDEAKLWFQHIKLKYRH